MALFADESVGAVEFKSSWKHERSTVSSGAQTREILSEEVDCQSVSSENVGVQTVNKEVDSVLKKKDFPGLAEFLKNIEPIMSKALLRNAQSAAFEGFAMSVDLESTICLSTHTLSHEELQGQLCVTSLSWNATGSVIAAAYGRFDHEDWCTHRSCLCTWNINKRNVTASKPDTVIDVPSCLLSVSFHPEEPALIVGGNFNGEILVWDLSKDSDTLLAQSSKGQDSHIEPISKVLWYHEAGTKHNVYKIMSVGTDGKMLIWSLDRDKGLLTLLTGFVLLASSMPRSVKVKSTKPNQEMGVSCLSPSTIDESIFFVGSESGGVFKCTANPTSAPIGDSSDKVALRSPVTVVYQPHRGPVYSIHSSPFHRNLFLTCSSDTTLRIQSALQTEPLKTIEPARGYLYSARWSPVRPLVLALSTQDGHVLVYDLQKSQTTPTHTLEASPSKSITYCMEFNHKQKQLMASGDARGVIRIWQLSDELTTEKTSERELLNELAEATQE